MKKLILIIIGILFLTSPVFAASTNLTTAMGNQSSSDYTLLRVYLVNTTILNNTVYGGANSTSAQEIIVRVALNISTNSSLPANQNSTLNQINLTLGDQFVINDVTKIKLLNASGGFIMNPNGTYSDGNYLGVWFNATNLTATTYGAVATDGGNTWTGAFGVHSWVSNASNMSFYIEYRLRPLDVNRTVTTTGGATQIYLDNVSYGGYSDLLPPVIITYTPSAWVSSGIINEVDYAYNYTTNYSTNVTTTSYLYYPSGQAAGVVLTPNQYGVLSILFTAPGATIPSTGTAGTTTTPLTATQVSTIWIWVTVAVVISGAAIVGLAWFFKYHRH
jgi:hypothetical protein